MRNVTWIIAVGLAAASTAGCVDLNSPYGGGSGYGYAPSNSGYSQGYAPSYGYSQGYTPTYYRQPAVNNYYVQPQPRVVTNTRYVPVPVQRAPDHRWGNNGPDHHWSGGNNGPDHHGPGQAQGRPDDHRPQQHDWHPAGNQQAGNHPAPQHPQPSHDRGSPQDRNGDGRPDSPRGN